MKPIPTKQTRSSLYRLIDGPKASHEGCAQARLGLKARTQMLIERIAEVPFKEPPPYEALIG